MAGIKYFIFDVDGTFAHDLVEWTRVEEEGMINVGNGYFISKDNISLLEQLRDKGVKIGFATSRRLDTSKSLIKSFSYNTAIIDYGAVIYLDGNVSMEWTDGLKPWIGDVLAETDGKRSGVLWDYARMLNADGYTLDELGKMGSFRVIEDESKLEMLASAQHAEGILAVKNGRGLDFFPAVAGKRNAILYVAHKAGLNPEEVAFAGNDYPDLDPLRTFYPMTLSGAKPAVTGLVSERNGYTSAQEKHNGAADLARHILQLQ